MRRAGSCDRTCPIRRTNWGKTHESTKRIQQPRLQAPPLQPQLPILLLPGQLAPPPPLQSSLSLSQQLLLLPPALLLPALPSAPLLPAPLLLLPGTCSKRFCSSRLRSADDAAA